MRLHVFSLQEDLLDNMEDDLQTFLQVIEEFQNDPLSEIEYQISRSKLSIDQDFLLSPDFDADVLAFFSAKKNDIEDVKRLLDSRYKEGFPKLCGAFFVTRETSDPDKRTIVYDITDVEHYDQGLLVAKSVTAGQNLVSYLPSLYKSYLDDALNLLKRVAVSEQNAGGLQFESDGTTPLKLVDHSGDSLNNEVDQKQGHADICSKTLQLAQVCEKHNEPNIALLGQNARALLKQAGPTLSDLRARGFWSEMNSLRRKLETDDAIREKPEDERDRNDILLPETPVGLLRDLVDTLNVFASFEPKLAYIDTLKPDPSKRLVKRETLYAATQIAEDAAKYVGLVEHSTLTSMQHTVEEATGEGPSADRAKQFAVLSERNFVLEVIRITYNGIKNNKMISAAVATPVAYLTKEVAAGYLRAGGADLYGSSSHVLHQAMRFIADHVVQILTLVDTLGRSQTIHRIIETILTYVK